MLRRFHIIYAALAAIFLIQSAFVSPSTVAAQTTGARDVVMILPFENTSNLSEYNWVGESFANSLADLLRVPGLVVLSNDERELAYQRLGLPLTTIPSLATAIRLARAANATMVVLGTYSVTVGQDKATATLLGQARVIKVNEGRVMGEVMPDGRWASRIFDFGDPLTELQRMQGRLAFDVLYARDKAFPFTRNELIERATKVPQLAFQTYLKGVLLTDDKEKRINYLKNALKFYSDAKGGAVYPEAAFELGQVYFQEQDWKQAAEYLSRLQKEDPHYTEAAFYAALAYNKQGNLRSALDVLMPLTPENSKAPLTSIVNNAGAISVQASREEKNPKEHDELLAQGIRFLKRAAESSSPDDSIVRFNYAYALFLSARYAEAAEQLRPIIAADPRDGQAYFLLAKALEKAGQAEQAAAADDQAKRFLPSYAKWQVEWQKSQTTQNVALRLRQAFNLSDVPRSVDPRDPVTVSGSPQEFLAQAQKLYQDGRDEEALQLLRRVLTIEPTSAEAFLLIGRINQRLGDQQAAISALKTAIFWESKTIDAHILLGRIFLELGDRGQALAYARSAIQIDPNNQEAIALQRQVETGGK